MSSNLESIEKSIDRLRKQLDGKRNTLVTIAPEEKVRIELQIEDLKADIAKLEREYWEEIQRVAQDWEITEEEAEPAIAEIVEGVAQLEASPMEAIPAELLTLLGELRDKLNQLEKSAGAKFKLAISTMPPFVEVAYEREVEAEGFIQKHFPTFRRLIRGQAKK